jgi:hypothetical protein
MTHVVASFHEWCRDHELNRALLSLRKENLHQP